MKKLLSKLTFTAVAIFFSATFLAQTAGTLTFTFSPVAKSPCYTGTQSVLAAWIQTNANAFVKTKLAYAGCCSTCGNTQDHVPNWSTNAGGLSTDCLNANVIDATTGATLSNFTAKSFTWDGKKGAAATGTLQPDGIYKVSIQETWNHGTLGTAMTSYTFTKGPAVDHRIITGDANFGNILINWQPVTTTGIEENASLNPVINVYPNPTNGVFNIDFKNATSIKVINTLGVIAYETKLDQANEGTKNIDLTSFANGVYFINVSNDKGYLNHKVILDK
jgi:hypothetical protein